MKFNVNDIIGQKFGKLTVLKFDYKKQYKRNNVIYRTVNYWKCVCECGNYAIVSTENLKSGSIKSCGCLRHKAYRTTHKLTNTRLYKIFYNMKARCYNPKNKRYKDYGGRGIIICNEWLNDFKTFYNWAINNGYNDNLTIDRIDVNGNYEPSNCRWVSFKTQENNKRNNKLITFKNKTLTLSEWADKVHISSYTIAYRLKQGWSIEAALTTSPEIYKNR